MKVADLNRLAKRLGISGHEHLTRAELEEQVLEAAQKYWEDKQNTLTQKEAKILQSARRSKVKQQVAATIEEEIGVATKSDMMRGLFDAGMTVAQIAKETNSNYSFVYSVIKKYKEEGAPARAKGESKSDLMRKLFDQGMSVAQIASETQSNYSFVYGVIKRYKEEKGIK